MRLYRDFNIIKNRLSFKTHIFIFLISGMWQNLHTFPKRYKKIFWSWSLLNSILLYNIISERNWEYWASQQLE